MRERVCLPFGWHGFSAERVRVSDGDSAGELVLLPFGWHGFNAEPVCVSGCAYHLAGMDSVLSGRQC